LLGLESALKQKHKKQKTKVFKAEKKEVMGGKKCNFFKKRRKRKVKKLPLPPPFGKI
jgi:hypothetical protein